MASLYAAIIILLNIPSIQQGLSVIVSEQLSNLLKTEVSIKNVNIGLLNRIILDDVNIDDLNGNTLFNASRMSAKFSIQSLLQGKIVINNIQLYQMQLNLQKVDSISKPNYQFLVETFASNDTTSNKNNLNLRINAILIRHGQISYQLLSEKETPQQFNPHHIHIKDLRANISLKALMNDSLNATIRHLSFEEHSGFTLKNLSLKLMANANHLTLSRFELELPNSHIKLDTLKMNYDLYAKDFMQSIDLQGGISKSYFTLSDCKAFLPALSSFTAPLWIQTRISGNAKELNIQRFHIESDNYDVHLYSHCRIRNPLTPEKSFIDCNLPELNITNTGLRFLIQNLGIPMSPIYTRIGFFSFNGYARGMLKDLQIQGIFKSSPGTIKTDMHLNLSQNIKSGYGNISAQDFELGTLTGNKDLGRTTFQIKIEGKETTNTYPQFLVNGHIPAFVYKQHCYQNIYLDILCNNGNYQGQFSIDDPNGYLSINGKYDPLMATPKFNLTATLDHFCPDKLKLSDKYPNTEFSIKVESNFEGRTFDDIIGYIRVDNLKMNNPQKNYQLHHFHVSSYPKEDKQREILIQSDFLNGKASGKFRIDELPNGIKRLLHKYLPSLIPVDEKQKLSSNQLEFELKVTDNELFKQLFQIPLNLYMPGSIKGYFNERNNQMKVEGYFPSFIYNDSKYESGMILIDNPLDKLQALVRISKQLESKAMLNLSLKAEAKNNKLLTSLNWGNNTDVTYSGQFATITEFFKHEKKNQELSAKINIQPSDVIINDTTWTLRNSTVTIDSGRVAINNFCFEHGEQHLRVNGHLTDSEDDFVSIDLNDIRLEYIFDILQFHPVDFRGFASGKAYIRQALKNPSLNTKLRIRQFTFNHGLMGDMDIKGLWNAEEGNIHLDADIREASNNSRTTVKGWVSPKINGLDLHITADHTNLAFLNEYTNSIFDRISGQINGYIHLHGPFSDLNLEGEASGNAKAKVGILRTEYQLQIDSVSLLPNAIEFNKVSMKDKDGHTGQIHGVLNHTHLRDFSYNFTFDTNNMLIYDAPDDTDASVYGSFYGTGTTHLQGGGNELNVNTNIRTGKSTQFIYNLGTPEEIVNNEFITFVDKTPVSKWTRPIVPDPFKEQIAEDTISTDETTTDVHINALLEVTPDANVKVIMDPVSGDYAMAKGSGNFQVSYFNKGDFKLYGTYTLDHGIYKLSLQEVIRKDFQLQPGGSITFSGIPERGDINLQAVYTVNSASLQDLAPNATFTQNSVKVNCLLNLSGKLANPIIHFDLDLPNVNAEERELVRSYISTDEQMERQIIYLLGIGRFYMSDYTSGGTDNTNEQSSAMNSLLSSTLSGQLNNMLSHAINNENWNFGTNLSTGTKGWTDMEVEGMLSGRLLNNRLLINGNFGYRDNQLANTNFVGDFDVQWLLTPSGDIRLKGYNQTNDRYFTKTTLTTQGVGIIFKRDFTHWKELFQRNKKVEKDTLRTDSIQVNTTKKKKKKNKKRKWSWDF